MESSGQLSATQSKEVLAELMTHGGDPARIAASLGYEQMDTAALDSMVDDVIASNPEEWQRYRAGEEKVAQFLLGKVMRATKGRAERQAGRGGVRRSPQRLRSREAGRHKARFTTKALTCEPGRLVAADSSVG